MKVFITVEDGMIVDVQVAGVSPEDVQCEIIDRDIAAVGGTERSHFVVGYRDESHAPTCAQRLHTANECTCGKSEAGEEL